jgi:hypothetical protein
MLTILLSLASGTGPPWPGLGHAIEQAGAVVTSAAAQAAKIIASANGCMNPPRAPGNGQSAVTWP